MQKLLDGIVNFKRGDFEIHKELFKSLKKNQKPHTLFITCSDSRLNPNMITGTLPGELFIIRNIANIIPAYTKASNNVDTTSAIEYAVLALGVENIIVCGHTNCGGCEASLNGPEQLEQLPDTRKWLELIEPVRSKVLKELKDDEPQAQQWMMEQINVVEQLKHLLTYPYIKEKVSEGTLVLSGWHYSIEDGHILIYDKELCTFILANEENSNMTNITDKG